MESSFIKTLNDIPEEAYGIIPSLLWFILVLGLLIFFRGNLIDLFSRLAAFEALGVKVNCMRESIDAAVELAKKSEKWQVDVPKQDERKVIERAKGRLGLFKGAQILWVDDEPENNLNERRMFRQLDCDLDCVKSTEEALNVLKAAPYDFIISDMARPESTTAGLEMVKALYERGVHIPVILYVGVHRPDLGVPPYAFGITNRPDQLLHLVLDVLERTKG